jgi:peptidoglycan hydrolase-like protein with peptidoglycan-binding domain
MLLVGERILPLKIGHLDPIDEHTGRRERLNNLGYRAGQEDDADDPAYRSAVEEFQCDYDLQVDGVCGPVTQGKLQEIHGC